MADVPDLEDVLPTPIAARDEGVAHAASIATLLPASGERTLMDDMIEEAVRANKQKQEQKRKEALAASATFGGGLGGGFLSTASPVPAPAPAPAPAVRLSGRCDNPGCGKTEAEVKSAGGKLLKCGHCKAVAYCGAVCQKAHWKAGHKSHCGRAVEVLPVKRSQAVAADPLRLPEVQDAMAKGVQGMASKLSDGKWMTPDFFAKIASNPRLLKAISDPRLTPFLQDMQHNPTKAMKQMKEDPELEGIFRDFCEVMGSHLSEFKEPEPDSAKS